MTTPELAALADSPLASDAAHRWAAAPAALLAAHLIGSAEALLDETTEADTAEVLDHRAALREAATRLLPPSTVDGPRP